MKKNRKDLKREKKNLRRLNEMKRKTVSTSEKVKTEKPKFKDMKILFLEGRDDYEIKKRLEGTGVVFEDLIWLGNFHDPIGKTYYNNSESNNKFLSEIDIQNLRYKLNPNIENER